MIERRLVLSMAAVVLFAAAGCSSPAQQTTGSAAPAASPAPKNPERSDEQITGPYNVDASWPKPMATWKGHQGWTWGATQGIYAESTNRILVAQRGELPVLKAQQTLKLVDAEGEAGPVSVFFPLSQAGTRNTTRDSPGEAGPYPGRKEGKDYRWEHIIYGLDSKGNLVEEWTQWDSLFKPYDIPRTARGRVHKIEISPYDPEKRIWIVDDGDHVIRIFSNDGKKLLQTIGTFRVTSSRNVNSLTKEKGDPEKTFGRQTDIAWLPDGTFFVSDGYEETRVMKFDKDGKFIKYWGEKGNAPPTATGFDHGDPPESRPNYFNTVHCVVVDKQRRVYVDDRSNRRIQVFDEDGKFLDDWKLGPYAAIYHMYMTEDQHIWMSDGHGTWKLLKYDLDGNMLYQWGTFGPRPGEMWGVHQFTVDQEGALYTAEVFNGRPQRFVPKPNADPARLVGQPVRVAWK